jgi:hypothetical protein
MVIKSPAASALRRADSKPELRPITRQSIATGRSGMSATSNVVMPSRPGTAHRRPAAGAASTIGSAAARPAKAPAASPARQRMLPFDVAEVTKEAFRRGMDFKGPRPSSDTKSPRRTGDVEPAEPKPSKTRKRTAIELRLEKPWFETRKLKRPDAKQQRSVLQILSVSIAIAAAGLLYIQHGFQMQEKMDRLQELDMALQRTRHLYTEKSLRYDRLTGPNEIYRRAQEAGLVNSGPADNRLTISGAGL